MFPSFLLLTTLSSLALGSSNTSFPTIDLGYAKYRGIRNDTLGIDTYYGLRFAAAPVGDLRWRQAVPIETAPSTYAPSKTINATVPGPQCIQASADSAAAAAFIGALSSAVPGLAAAAGATLYNYTSSEDCLLLNVVVPTAPASSALPVVVGIHGGGYTSGNAGGIDGSQLVAYSSGSVIHVAIQYRLGAYGFLGAREVLADGAANLGLLDQQLAFQWVQKHISAFGGDPEKITLWGVSAGGGSVMNHLILNGAQDKPLFRGAVSEFPWWQPYHDTPVLEAQYQQLLNASGCADLPCLRSLPEDKLANTTQTTYLLGAAQGSYGQGDSYFGPFVDGKVVPDLPSNLFKQGKFHRVPMIVDHDQMEGFFFQDYSINTTALATADLQRVWPAAGPSFFQRLYEVYQLPSFLGSYFTQPFFSSAFYKAISPSVPNLQVAAQNAPFWRMSQIFGDFIISCPTYYMASAFTNVVPKVPVWKLVCNAGVYVHGAIGVYVSAANEASGNPGLSAMLKDYYLSFVVSGDPNELATFGGGNVTRGEWPLYLGDNATQFSVLEVRDTGLNVTADGDASDRCDFFHSQSYVVRN